LDALQGFLSLLLSLFLLPQAAAGRRGGAPPHLEIGRLGPNIDHRPFSYRYGAAGIEVLHNLARSCADSDWRSSANQGRGSLFRHTGRVASVDHTWLLRRSARCSVITQRARMHAACSNGRPSDRLRFFFMCGLVLCGSSAGQSRRKNGLPHPGREPRGCLHAGGEKRGHLVAPAAGRQTKWGGYREGPLASDIGSFSHGRAAQTRPGAQDFIA
jgi:hypothetical protein